jgi:hypothetical protein
MKLTTQHHLVPSLRMMSSYSFSPLYTFMACTGGTNLPAEMEPGEVPKLKQDEL